MGSSTANISRRLYDERKRYVQTVLQQGVPLVDADYNEAQESFYAQIRRAVQAALGDGAPGVAFKVEERREGGALVENDLLVRGGYHPRSGPERLWVAGHGAALFEDVPWSASPEITPRSTGMTACELHDSAAFYEPDALVGRALIPNIANSGKRYEIVANTINSITVAEGEDLLADGARPGDPYRIALTTPSEDRVDTVYVDAYLDEIDATEDPELLHTFSTKLEAMRRLKLVQSVLVAEGTEPPAPTNPDEPLVDADGNEHFILPIARVRREANNPRIENRMIEDLRRQIFSLDQVEDRYINADGDTMRGDLAFLPGTAIRGEAVVGEAELADDSVSQRKLQRRTHLLGDGGIVPAASRLPVVHDNRYFTKSVLATFFGPNLVANGSFEKGLRGWIEKAPFPVHGAPGQHVLEKVRVGWRLCGPDCCRGLFVHFHPGFKGCEVCAVAQEIPVCGGGLFAWTQSVRVARGNERVHPFLAVGLFASEQFLGQVRVPFHETLDLGNGETTHVPVVLHREDGLRRLRTMFELDACVDRIVVALCFEVDFDGCAVDELLEVTVCDVRGWRFADDGTIDGGTYVPPLPPPFDPGDPGVPVPVPEDPIPTGGGDGETIITESRTTKVPLIDRVTTTGEVVYRLAHRQTWLNVYRTLDPVTSLAWDPATSEVRNPELVEVVPTRTPELLTTDVGGEPGPPPPWIFTVDPVVWVIGETTHVVVTGKDFSPDLSVAVVPSTGVVIENVNVSPEGDCVEFDIVLNGAAPGTAALVLANPDGQEAEVTIRIEEPAQPPVPTTLELATPTLEVTAGQEAPVTLVVLDQDGQPMPGAEVAAETTAPAFATVTSELTTTDDAGQAAFTIAGIADGSATITFVAGDAQATLAVAVAAEPAPIVGSLVPSAEAVNLGSGGTGELTVQVLDEASQPLAGQAVVAASSNAAVVAVAPAELATDDQGKATFALDAVGPGSAGVTVKASGLTLTVPVSVALPPPLIEAVAPADLFPGTTQLIEVFGAGFQAGLTLAVSPATGITLGTPAVLNGGTLVQVEAQLAPDVALGPVALTVTNPDGQPATLTGAFRVIEPALPGPGDVGFPTLDVELHDATPNSLRVLLDPNGDPVTILHGALGAAEGLPPGEKTVAAINPDGTVGNLRFVVAGELGTPVDFAVGLVDGAGQVATVQVGTLQPSDLVILDPATSDALLRELVTLGATVALPAGTFVPVEVPLEAAVTPTGFDFNTVAGLRLTLTPHPAPEGTQSTLWFDSFVLVRDAEGTVDALEDFAAYADQGALDAYWQDIGARHVVQVESAISRELVPVIVAPSDRVLDLRFHGDPGWEEAEVVLVKATEANRSAGILDEDRGLRYGAAHYREAPFEGCRNVFIEPAYIASAPCRAVVARARPFEFVAGDCECSPEFPQVQRIGDFVSDPLLHRILPDDGFRGTPTTYGEMFALEYCVPEREEAWVRIGSRSTPGQVLHAGGGRNDPEVPPGLPQNPQTSEPIYVTLYHGPGSPQGARESLIAVDVPVPAGTAEVDVIVSPADATGFAVGMPVWLRNDCHPGHPRCRISSCEVEASPHDPSVYGLYGEVVAIEPNDNRVRVRFFEPPQVGAKFLTELKAALLVSPRHAMGYYWEASPGLVDLVSATEGICIRWWFRYWEAAASRCTLHGPFEEAGVLLCDGDGQTRNFPFVGETGAVIDPAEWRSIWSKPIEPCRLWNDLAPGGNTLEVCTPQRFERGDVVRVVDDRWPTGWRATVVAVDTVNNRLRLAEPLPEALPGLEGFDGFKITRNAVAFRAAVRANIMKSPTTRSAPDGTPLFGPDFVVVDFDAGRFTFDPSFAGPVRIFYGAEWRTYRLPAVHGIYKLQAVNFAGIPGWYSDLIRVGPLQPLIAGGVS